MAEILGGSYDENVQTTLNGVSASTAIEQRTLELVLDLVGIRRSVFAGRVLRGRLVQDKSIKVISSCGGDDNEIIGLIKLFYVSKLILTVTILV